MRQTRIISVCQRIFGVRGVEIGIALLRVNWIGQLNMLINVISVITVAYFSDSMIAVLMLLCFGAWNHYTGFRDGQRQPEKSQKDPDVSVAMIEQIKKLKPGGALRYNVRRHQIEFVVMEASDFDHIIDVAKLIQRPRNIDDN